jgi:transposase
MTVMIGIDPHKASHTAAAIDDAEHLLGEVRVRASACQLEQLLGWAARFEERTWAIEGASGLGYLLAQQLVSAGERVLDVQPKLAARVRLLANGSTNKNDPNDARSVAVAALRSPAVREVRAEDHAEVMRLWAKRRRDLARTRNRVVCRLHSLLLELVPGGIPGQLYASKAEALLAAHEPDGAVELARRELAAEMLVDLRRIDEQMREAKKRLATAVAASGSTLSELYGVGPVVAAIVIGETGDVRRFSSRDRFAAYNATAPVEVSSGPRKVFRLSMRGNRRLNHAIHMAAVTQVRHAGTEGRIYYERKIAEGKTPKEALRSLKRKVSDAIFAKLQADAARRTTQKKGPGGQPGNGSSSSAAGSHPKRRLFGQATPEPAASLRPRPAARRRAKAPASTERAARQKARRPGAAAISPQKARRAS